MSNSSSKLNVDPPIIRGKMKDILVANKEAGVEPTTLKQARDVGNWGDAFPDLIAQGYTAEKIRDAANERSSKNLPHGSTFAKEHGHDLAGTEEEICDKVKKAFMLNQLEGKGPQNVHQAWQKVFPSLEGYPLEVIMEVMRKGGRFETEHPELMGAEVAEVDASIDGDGKMESAHQGVFQDAGITNQQQQASVFLGNVASTLGTCLADSSGRHSFHISYTQNVVQDGGVVTGTGTNIQSKTGSGMTDEDLETLADLIANKVKQALRKERPPFSGGIGP